MGKQCEYFPKSEHRLIIAQIERKNYLKKEEVQMTNTSKIKLMKMGLKTNGNGDVKDFNGNLFAEITTKNYDLHLTRDSCFY